MIIALGLGWLFGRMRALKRASSLSRRRGGGIGNMGGAVARLAV